MLPEYDIAKLERAMFDFNKATGVSITLYDVDKKPVTKTGVGKNDYCAHIARTGEMKHSCSRSNSELLEKCRRSGQMEKHLCRAGLLDIVIPLIHLGEIVGYLMIGQIKQSECVPDKLSDLFCSYPDIAKKYGSIPLFDEARINSVINIGEMLTRYIMLENMVRTQPNRNAAIIENYVNEHLCERISVNAVAESTHMSVSGIYKCLKQSRGMTLGELVCTKRLERAAALLLGSDLSISEIAEQTGFSDTPHFSKNFKKAHGISPLKYRKNAGNCN